MVSHTATGEWQSFEGRMRQRRAERLALRAEVAADAGCVEEAREALAEARMLSPRLPQLDLIQRKLDRSEEVPVEVFVEASPLMELPAVVELPPEGGSYEPTPVASASRRKSAAAAAMVALLAGGGAGLIYGGHRQPPLQPTQEFREPAQEVAPPATHAVAPAPTDHLDTTAPPAPVADPQPVSTIGSLEKGAQAAPRLERNATRGAENVLPASFKTPAPVPAPVPPPSPVSAPLNPVALPDTTAPPVPPLDRGVTREAADTPRPPSIATDTLSATPGAAAAAPEPVAPPQDSLVRAALDRYAAAYSSLDADAAQRAWPGVNRAALSRAFDGLASQRVSLGSCSIDVNGPTARARCAGSTTWQAKVGSGGAKTDRHTWMFDLARTVNGWQILNARVQNR